ncbi:hypothetical protein A8F94_10015 [Bacillus sp. FJAT-27225]|uniref:DUF421 domain-containing protein n=1 Tax=Bacillus sp. FJAT-27225 TaxID=1743144 RepID=UPI00080C2764|nr:DUF421 domain-containing protein [Bacillus sp. FJAT-27225]OCA88141.1 hypothetical protein A8F94_10015 [Bacillus sp. FJAT-27225]
MDSNWFDIVLRSFLFLAALFLMTKLLGKKQISQISFFEYVSGITIGSIAAEVIMGLERNLWHGIVAIFIFFAITYLVDYISLKNKKVRDFTEGKATVFIENGNVLEENLKKELYTIDDLNTLLRNKNVFNISEVEYAVLEPTGDINVFLKKENQPLTPKDLNLNVTNQQVTQTVIMDGKISYDSLAAAKRTPLWLKAELEKRGLTVEKVFLAQVDSFGKLTVDLYDN